ncbi:MAG: nickel pincer cofactor biosynthesis protein LarB [Dehalococcoidia bacterium]|nr:nickel pincer cofactor biosynthesis protein LarB [Dehalococcoidia bacterium]
MTSVESHGPNVATAAATLAPWMPTDSVPCSTNSPGAKTDVDRVLREVQSAPFTDLGFARVDHHRGLRDGLPEVILASGKTADQVVNIAREIDSRGGLLLATRLSAEQAQALDAEIPGLSYDPLARVAWKDPSPRPCTGNVTVVTAGTSDIPVAEEAAITATLMGAEVTRLFDVGVAGVHRLAGEIDTLRAANVLVVVAGMEGALPSVIGGLVQNPVVAVPTSVGYGASFGGLAAMLGMLNSCATGVSVVNIDNGFGAGYLAATINRLAMAQPPRSEER